MRRNLRGRTPMIAVSLVMVVVAVAVLVVALFAVNATRDARQATREADQATTCNGLLLASIAVRQVRPEARDLGCDVLTAQTVIDRSRDRDGDLATTRAELAKAATDRAALERQIVDLGQRPVTRTTVLPRAVPSSPGVLPSPAQPTRPAAPAPTPARPSPTPAPTAAPSPAPAPAPTARGLLPDVVCGLLGC